MTAFVVAAARVLFVIAAAPGRLLIRWIDRRKADNGVAPLGGFLRGSVHAFVWFCAFIALVMVNGPTPTASRSASSVAPAAANPAANQQQAERKAAPVGQQARVARIIDGDTFELSDGRTVRVLGIDSCETDTPEGALATSDALTLLTGGKPIQLRTEPGVTTDRYGRLLRYVDVGGQDFGTWMVGYDHTGVYQGDNDAAEAYVDQLYANDLKHAANPPSGRECGSYPPSVPVEDDDGYVPPPDGDDHNMRDGALTGGYCARKWWC